MLTSSTRQAIRNAVEDIRAALFPLIGFDLIVAAISAVVFTPLLAWLFATLVASTGKGVLSDMEIAGFLASPSGIASLVLLLSVFLSFAVFSSAGFTQILLDQIRCGKTNVVQTLVATLYRMPSLGVLIAIVIGVVLAVAVPFLGAIAYFALPLITEFDINYYLAEKPPEFIKALAITGPLLVILLAIYLYLFIGWALAIPLLLIRGLSPVSCLKESRRLVAGRKKEISLLILSWVFTVVIITLGLAWFADLFMGVLIGLHSNLTVLIFMIGIVTLVNGVVALVVSFISLTSLNAVLARVYLDMSGGPAKLAASSERVGMADLPALRLSRKAWLGLGISAFLVTSGFAWLQIKGIDLTADVLVIAHRGSSLAAPENTMAAVNLALDEGADYVEIDVQEDSEGAIVVLHDADLKRVAGIPSAIADIDWNETRDIDIGSWFDAQFSGERLPLLADVLEVSKDRAGVNIELKYTKRADKLASRVVDVVAAAGARDRVEYMSLSYDGAQEIRQLDPDARVGFLSNVSIGNLTEAEVDFLAVSSRAATETLISRAHDSNMMVYVWTVNTPLEMALFIDRGVDGIITDAPKLLNNVMAQMNELSLVERLLLRYGSESGLELGESAQ